MSTERRQPFAKAIKRAFDVVSCSAIALAVAPAFPLLAAMVKYRSPGPMFFVQQRTGLHGRPFSMYKLRTMSAPPPGHDATKWTNADEERITPFGRFFRDYGIDELPQILNIIKGDMSVIGPRPPLPAQAAQYTDEQKRMFNVRPGVLSLAAIHGRRSISAERRIELHVEYADRWSLALDCEILWKSLFVVLGRENATEKL
jgi:lipopolysaccharide/colanic/teichoic acid biosynthesis glycosyltransferase